MIVFIWKVIMITVNNPAKIKKSPNEARKKLVKLRNAVREKLVMLRMIFLITSNISPALESKIIQVFIC